MKNRDICEDRIFVKVFCSGLAQSIDQARHCQGAGTLPVSQPTRCAASEKTYWLGQFQAALRALEKIGTRNAGRTLPAWLMGQWTPSEGERLEPALEIRKELIEVVIEGLYPTHQLNCVNSSHAFFDLAHVCLVHA